MLKALIVSNFKLKRLTKGYFGDDWGKTLLRLFPEGWKHGYIIRSINARMPLRSSKIFRRALSVTEIT